VCVCVWFGVFVYFYWIGMEWILGIGFLELHL